jgi:hypothetical protein
MSEIKHLRQMKLVVFEGADQTGDPWWIIRAPQGLNREQVFALKDADLEHIVKNSANLVDSLSLWKIGGTTLARKHVQSLLGPDREVRMAALRKVAGLERLRIVEDFNLLQVQVGNTYPAPLPVDGVMPYLFEVKNGLIQSAQLMNWLNMVDIDGKSLTQEQKDGIAQFKYLDGEGLPLTGMMPGKRKRY